MDRPGEELREAVVAALGREALPVSELRARLGPPWDRPAGRDDLDRLLQTDLSFTQLSDGFALVPALVEGTSWTVWVDADDARHGFVRTHPQLAPLGWWLIGDDVALIDDDGQRIATLETDGVMLDGRDTDVVFGPEGWLDELSGGWARVDVREGALRWSPLEELPVATSDQIEAFTAGFDRAARDARSLDDFDVAPLPAGLRFASGGSPMLEALLADPAAWRGDPIPPLTHLYAAAGFDERDGIVAPDGFDWDIFRAWQTRNRVQVSYGLDAGQADHLARLVGAFPNAADGSPEFAEALAALDDGDLAAAFWGELGWRGHGMAAVERFVTALAVDEPSIGLAWLQARVLDRSGDAATANDLLEATVDNTCRHGPALLDLAAFRADRGDAAGALRLLMQAGIGPSADDELDEGQLLWEEVEGFAMHRPRSMARRNDPCPCGSGRKYKVCHLGREMHALDDRSGWLYFKAARFLRERRPSAAEEITAIAIDEDAQPEVFDALAEGPFMADLVLHEEGMFREFLAARDVLLPDDEALLAAQWALVDRGVFEIVDKDGTEIELRNIGSGERIRVVNTDPSRQARTGTLLVGRPLPVGDTYRAFSGFLEIPLRLRDLMLDAVESRDSEAIAEVLGAVFAPPRLTNTDEQDLVAHTARFRVPQPDRVGSALVAAGLKDEGDDAWTLVRDSKNQRDTVIASLHLVGDELTVETNSTERAAELRQIVANAIAGAEIIDEHVRSVEVPRDPDRASGGPPAVPDDPALRAALAEYIAEYEQRWLDEPIPALGGRTPREAAADPLGREELSQLLNSLPEPGPGDIGAMDPRRLRAALGL